MKVVLRGQFLALLVFAFSLVLPSQQAHSQVPAHLMFKLGLALSNGEYNDKKVIHDNNNIFGAPWKVSDIHAEAAAKAAVKVIIEKIGAHYVRLPIIDGILDPDISTLDSEYVGELSRISEVFRQGGVEVVHQYDQHSWVVVGDSYPLRSAAGAFTRTPQPGTLSHMMQLLSRLGRHDGSGGIFTQKNEPEISHDISHSSAFSRGDTTTHSATRLHYYNPNNVAGTEETAQTPYGEMGRLPNGRIPAKFFGRHNFTGSGGCSRSPAGVRDSMINEAYNNTELLQGRDLFAEVPCAASGAAYAGTGGPYNSFEYFYVDWDNSTRSFDHNSSEIRGKPEFEGMPFTDNPNKTTSQFTFNAAGKGLTGSRYLTRRPANLDAHLGYVSDLLTDASHWINGEAPGPSSGSKRVFGRELASGTCTASNPHFRHTRKLFNIGTQRTTYDLSANMFGGSSLNPVPLRVSPVSVTLNPEQSATINLDVPCSHVRGSAMKAIGVEVEVKARQLNGQVVDNYSFTVNVNPKNTRNLIAPGGGLTYVPGPGSRDMRQPHVYGSGCMRFETAPNQAAVIHSIEIKYGDQDRADDYAWAGNFLVKGAKTLAEPVRLLSMDPTGGLMFKRAKIVHNVGSTKMVQYKYPMGYLGYDFTSANFGYDGQRPGLQQLEICVKSLDVVPEGTAEYGSLVVRGETFNLGSHEDGPSLSFDQQSYRSTTSTRAIATLTGPPNAYFLLLGSATGTSPGFSVPMLDPQGTVVNVRVPLFNDVYTFYSFLQGGMTDSNGVGNYTVPVMQGLMGDFYHVGLFIDPQTSAYLGSTPVVHTSVVP